MTALDQITQILLEASTESEKKEYMRFVVERLRFD